MAARHLQSFPFAFLFSLSGQALAQKPTPTGLSQFYGIYFVLCVFL